MATARTIGGALVLAVLLHAAGCSFVERASRPDPCPKAEVQTFIKQTKDAMSKLSDAVERGEATSRLALSPVIADIQQTRREYRALPHPECADEAAKRLSEAMDLAVDAFLTFARQAPERDVEIVFRNFSSAMRMAKIELDRLEAKVR